MLVLTRSCDEEIRIGHDVIVRVLDVKGDRVRLGIVAPPEVAVHRQEIYLEIERANREAMQVASAGLEGAKTLVKGHTGTRVSGNTQSGNASTKTRARGDEREEKDSRKKPSMEVRNGT